MTSNQKFSQYKIFKDFKSPKGRSDTIVVSDSDFKSKKHHRKSKQQNNPIVVVAAPKKPSATVNHTIGNPREIIYKF